MKDARITPESRHEAHVHYVTAFIGGFLGLFPILNVAGVLGSSQTSNLIECVLTAIRVDWTGLWLHLTGAVLYSSAVFLVTFLNAHSRINVKILSLLIDMAAGIVMWKMPDNLPVVVYMYPTFFAMAFQWTAFTGSYGYISSTIFSTNNLKQLVSAITEFTFNGRPEFKLKAVFYGLTLIGFHLGIASSYLLWTCFGNTAFLFVIVAAIFNIVMIVSKKL